MQRRRQPWFKRDGEPEAPPSLLAVRRTLSTFFWACLIASTLFSGTGCKPTEAEEVGSIHRDAGMSGPENIKLGSQGQIVVPTGTEGAPGAGRTYLNCSTPKRVNKADPKTAEGTLYMVFAALLVRDEDEAFTQFYSHINPQLQRESDARRYWFGAARKDGGNAFQRLVYGPSDPTFDICSVKPEGEGKVRIFVAKSPPVGSNPPFVLHKVGDKWLLENFTPH